MDNLNIYRNGELPALKQQLHRPRLHILRCSYWALQAWNHTNLSAPYWRLYWNRTPGAHVVWKGRTHALEPDRLVLIGPKTPFTSHLGPPESFTDDTNFLIGAPMDESAQSRSSQLTGHLFAHFTLGLPHDGIRPFVLDVPMSEESRHLIDIIASALVRDRNRLNHAQSLALESLIFLTLTHIPEEDWPERQLDPRVLRVLDHIENSLHLEVQNKDLAALANMSPNAFTRLFLEKTGLTPLAHLKRRRIEKASILLHHTDMSIERIAEACGFSDRNYFTRVFCKRMGIGPASFRKHRSL